MTEIFLHHISLIVSDVNKSLNFYSNFLNLEIDKTRPKLSCDGVWFKIGKQQIHLLQVPNPDNSENRPIHGGSDRHIAFKVKKLNLFIARLNALKIPFQMSKSGRSALFCRDPDGNTFELIESE
mgnify:CR=1 FL=1|tara:strand:- start:1396 stop:1767 length:372 start_codon:yes stop_codon:yes gene_type:complete